MENLVQILKDEKEENAAEGIYEWLQIAFAFHSCRIDGNQTTYKWVRRLFRHRNEKEAENSYDHAEIIEHFQLFDAMIESVRKPLTVELIKSLHKTLRDDTEDYLYRNDIAPGEFRVKEPLKTGCKPEDIAKEMDMLLGDFSEGGKIKKMSMTDIAQFHLRFEKIHPFPDDNGAIGRMLITKQCLENNLPPAIPGDDTKNIYFSAFTKEDPVKAMEDYLKKEQWLYERMLGWWGMK